MKADVIEPLMLDARAVARSLGIAKATLHRLVREGSFPLGRRLSRGRVAWLRADVERWCSSRPESTDPVRVVLRSKPESTKRVAKVRA